MTTRKAIRDAAKVAITAYDSALTIYTGRALSIPSDKLPAISVYFEDGSHEVVDADSDSLTSATLKLDVTDSNDGNDDAIDTLSDALIETVLSEAQLTDLLFSWSYAGFVYERDNKLPYTTLSASIALEFT